jgi:hypothetical protein
MKMVFPKKSTEKIVVDLKKAMKAHFFSKSVSLSHSKNELTVTISKLGTSTLIFKRKDTPKSTQFSLAKQNIALAHRAFQAEVKTQFAEVVEDAGGKVSGS